MPTTSPARTVKFAPSTILRSWVGCQTVQSSTRKTSSPGADSHYEVEVHVTDAGHFIVTMVDGKATPITVVSSVIPPESVTTAFAFSTKYLNSR
jgi:hypothetical protein